MCDCEVLVVKIKGRGLEMDVIYLWKNALFLLRSYGFANAVDARPANARDTMHPTLFKRVAGTKLEEKERKKGRRRKKKRRRSR